MGWTETHRRWRALREIEATLRRTDPVLPWTEEYADIFGDPDTLLALLRYRLELSYATQLDTHLPEPVIEEHRRRLDIRFAGVRRLLATYDGDANVAA